MTGLVFGRLTVLERGENSNRGKARWVCRCDCGRTTTVAGADLRSGHTQSCICLHREVVTGKLTTHGMSKITAHRSWEAMIQRCSNPKNPTFKNYGGRGIKVCEAWLTFEQFVSDMGERPAGTSLGRINNECGYEPSNCRWETPKTQARNTRRTRFVRFNGEVHKLTELADALGVSQETMKMRAKRGSFGISYA